MPLSPKRSLRGVITTKPCPERSEGTLEIATGRPRNDFVGLPRLRAVTPACTKRSGEDRHFGVQARRFAPRNDNLLWTYTIISFFFSFFFFTDSNVSPLRQDWKK